VVSENSILSYLFLVFCVSFIFLYFGSTRAIIAGKIKRIPGFCPEASFIGINSGIAFNFKSGTVVFSAWYQFTPVVFNHSDIAKHSDGELMIERWVKDIKPSAEGLTIHTNMYDRPMINIGFWTRNQTARCLIALRQVTQERIGDADDLIVREKFIKALQKQISKKSLSNRKIGARERDDLIDFLLENTEKICARPSKHGDNLRIAEAMFHFFGYQEDASPASGYKLSALQKRVGQLKNSFSKKTI